MDKNINNTITSSFDIIPAISNELYLLNPLILSLIVIVICFILYIIGFRLNKKDI